jgi:hypothetical protein
LNLSAENTSSGIATAVATEVKVTDTQETKKAEKKKEAKGKTGCCRCWQRSIKGGFSPAAKAGN